MPRDFGLYCEGDVLNIYRLWLIYELFRGAITAEQLAFSEAQAAEFVRTRKADNPHLAASVSTSEAAEDAKSPLQAVLQWFT